MEDGRSSSAFVFGCSGARWAKRLQARALPASLGIVGVLRNRVWHHEGFVSDIRDLMLVWHAPLG